MSNAANSARIFYHLARADFLERVRRYSFLLTMGISIYLGYAAATGQLAMRVNDSRGVFNSAWIGGLMALVATTFLSLAGFYVVKNTIERDRLTRVGEILASTPMSKTLYVMGKAISNFVVLACMVRNSGDFWNHHAILARGRSARGPVEVAGAISADRVAGHGCGRRRSRVVRNHSGAAGRVRQRAVFLCVVRGAGPTGLCRGEERSAICSIGQDYP